MTAHDVTFACQAEPRDCTAWSSLARRVEEAGFDALCIGDHPGTTVSPFVALAAAAPVTSSLRLGTAVVNGGVREPLDIANDVASLALVADGRAVLGIGAGHTPQEWHATGRHYPSPTERIRRLGELVPLVQQLLAGDVVDHQGDWFTLKSAHLDIAPEAHLPVLVGGNSRGTIRLGAETADIVELGGLGRTLPDEHIHEARWKPSQTDQIIDAFHDAVRSRATPTLGALVQRVVVTDDAERAATRFLDDVAARQPEETLPSVGELIEDVPFILIGTIDEITHQVQRARQRWGFSRFTVREPAIDAIAEVTTSLTPSWSRRPTTVER
jgi:probable F420-dependent oxidoreductase